MERSATIILIAIIAMSIRVNWGFILPSIPLGSTAARLRNGIVLRTLSTGSRPFRQDLSNTPMRNDRRQWGDRERFRERSNWSAHPDRRNRWDSRDREDRDEPNTLVTKYGEFNDDLVYGINPVFLALKSKRRKLHDLLVQEDLDADNKKQAGQFAKSILSLATEYALPIQYASKHDLNMLSDNRPHQGFILRASFLSCQPLPALEAVPTTEIALALDEVTDPQNLGALLRSALFLGCRKVILCAKNSAPLNNVVSKASAGAMEVLTIFEAQNMMRFLDNSKENGWQVVGADLGSSAVSLDALKVDRPTILVLGNEGHGMRVNIVKRCDQLVYLPGSGSDVDSLNVSVTGGILLHHLSRFQQK